MTKIQKKQRVYRGIPETQLESWKILQESDKPQKDKVKVIAALRKSGPLTSRALAKFTGCERTSITRTLYDLQYESKIVFVAAEKPCPVTKRRVRWYDLYRKYKGPQDESGQF